MAAKKRPSIDDLIDIVFDGNRPARPDANDFDHMLATSYACAHALVRQEYEISQDPDLFPDRKDIFNNADVIARTAHRLAQGLALLQKLQVGIRPPEVPPHTLHSRPRPLSETPGFTPTSPENANL